MSEKKPLFSKNDPEFFNILRSRVDRYLKENRISPKANGAMIAKSAFLLTLLAVCYGSLYTGGGWIVLLKYFFLGIAVALATMNISHDALHGAYSSSNKLNQTLAHLMDLCGKSAHHWGRGHVIDHHSFTNIGGHDHDLQMENPLLRLCPEAPYRSHQRWQHLYAPLLYCLYPLFAQATEIRATFRMKENLRKTGILLLKAIHFVLFLILPALIDPLTLPQVLLGYICYGSGVGATLAFVFQLAHIVEQVSFPKGDEAGKLEDNFVVHQLKTTANFSTKSRLAHFIFGGLNYQVEHHLFPHLCHIHLYKLSPLIQEEIRNLKLPYYENPTAFGALKSHFKTLKRLGRGKAP